MDCVYEIVEGLYRNGGRYFVLLNLAPLELLPQYATPERGGLAATKFYPNKGSNITEISYRMWESVVTVNEVFRYRTAVEVEIERRWKDAKVANFDVNSLVSFWEFFWGGKWNWDKELTFCGRLRIFIIIPPSI